MLPTRRVYKEAGNVIRRRAQGPFSKSGERYGVKQKAAMRVKHDGSLLRLVDQL